MSSDRVNVCDSGLILTFLHTKTIQFDERVLHVPLVRSDSPLCPVVAYSHSASFYVSSSGGPAFLFCDASGKVAPLLAGKFVSVIRDLLSRAGVSDAQSFRGHSFRRGGASWAFNNGVPGELIQVVGDWKSDAYKVYLEFSMSSKLLIAQRLAHNLPL